MNIPKLAPRVIVLVLSLALALPGPALALRTEQKESKGGLEEIRQALEGGPDQLLEFASNALGLSPSVTPATARSAVIPPSRATGLEEGKRSAEVVERGVLPPVPKRRGEIELKFRLYSELSLEESKGLDASLVGWGYGGSSYGRADWLDWDGRFNDAFVAFARERTGKRWGEWIPVGVQAFALVTRPLKSGARPRTAEAMGLHVDGDWRGPDLQIGTKLRDKTYAYLKGKGYSRFKIDLIQGNEGSQKFHKAQIARLGLAVKEVRYYPHSQDIQSVVIDLQRYLSPLESFRVDSATPPATGLEEPRPIEAGTSLVRGLLLVPKGRYQKGNVRLSDLWVVQKDQPYRHDISVRRLNTRKKGGYYWTAWSRDILSQVFLYIPDTFPGAHAYTKVSLSTPLIRNKLAVGDIVIPDPKDLPEVHGVVVKVEKRNRRVVKVFLKPVDLWGNRIPRSRSQPYLVDKLVAWGARLVWKLVDSALTDTVVSEGTVVSPTGLEESQREWIERVLMEDPEHPDFLRFTIPPGEAYQLDLHHLYDLMKGTGGNFGHASAHGWLEWQLTHHLLDPKEILSRQEAIQEILTAQIGPRPLMRLLDPQFLEWPTGWDGGGQESYGIWNIVHDESYRLDFIQIFLRQNYPDTESGKREKERDRFLKDMLQRSLIQLFEGMRVLEEVLMVTQSPRLQAIRWVASAVTDSKHPYQLYSLAQNSFSDSAIVEALQNNYRSLALLLRAAREIDSYRILARLAAAGGKPDWERVDAHYQISTEPYLSDQSWRNFPRVLHPSSGEGPVLRIEDGHSPTLIAEDPTASIRNTLHLGGTTDPRFITVTGPNMEGKSTLLRTAAQLVVLASLGSAVPAKEMEWTPLGVRAQMNLEDDPQGGRSLFKVESDSLYELRGFAQRNPFTLILMDEGLEGTNPIARQAGEWAILPEFAKTGALTIVATHNLNVTGLGQQIPGMANFHVESFRLTPGSIPLVQSNEGAFQVLESSGWEPEVMKRARMEAERLMKSNPVPPPPNGSGLEEVREIAAELERLSEEEGVILQQADAKKKWKELGAHQRRVAARLKRLTDEQRRDPNLFPWVYKLELNRMSLLGHRYVPRGWEPGKPLSARARKDLWKVFGIGNRLVKEIRRDQPLEDIPRSAHQRLRRIRLSQGRALAILNGARGLSTQELQFAHQLFTDPLMPLAITFSQLSAIYLERSMRFLDEGETKKANRALADALASALMAVLSPPDPLLGKPRSDRIAFDALSDLFPEGFRKKHGGRLWVNHVLREVIKERIKGPSGEYLGQFGNHPDFRSLMEEISVPSETATLEVASYASLVFSAVSLKLQEYAFAHRHRFVADVLHQRLRRNPSFRNYPRKRLSYLRRGDLLPGMIQAGPLLPSDLLRSIHEGIEPLMADLLPEPGVDVYQLHLVFRNPTDGTPEGALIELHKGWREELNSQLQHHPIGPYWIVLRHSPDARIRFWDEPPLEIAITMFPPAPIRPFLGDPNLEDLLPLLSVQRGKGRSVQASQSRAAILAALSKRKDALQQPDLLVPLVIRQFTGSSSAKLKALAAIFLGILNYGNAQEETKFLAQESLRNALRKERDPHVRAYAAWAMGNRPALFHMQPSPNRQALRQASREDPSGMVRRAADETLDLLFKLPPLEGNPESGLEESGPKTGLEEVEVPEGEALELIDSAGRWSQVIVEGIEGGRARVAIEDPGFFVVWGANLYGGKPWREKNRQAVHEHFIRWREDRQKDLSARWRIPSLLPSGEEDLSVIYFVPKGVADYLHGRWEADPEQVSAWDWKNALQGSGAVVTFLGVTADGKARWRVEGALTPRLQKDETVFAIPRDGALELVGLYDPSAKLEGPIEFTSQSFVRVEVGSPDFYVVLGGNLREEGWPENVKEMKDRFDREDNKKQHGQMGKFSVPLERGGGFPQQADLYIYPWEAARELTQGDQVKSIREWKERAVKTGAVVRFLGTTRGGGVKFQVSGVLRPDPNFPRLPIVERAIYRTPWLATGHEPLRIPWSQGMVEIQLASWSEGHVSPLGEEIPARPRVGIRSRDAFDIRSGILMRDPAGRRRDKLRNLLAKFIRHMRSGQKVGWLITTMHGYHQEDERYLYPEGTAERPLFAQAGPGELMDAASMVVRLPEDGVDLEKRAIQLEIETAFPFSPPPGFTKLTGLEEAQEYDDAILTTNLRAIQSMDEDGRKRRREFLELKGPTLIPWEHLAWKQGIRLVTLRRPQQTTVKQVIRLFAPPGFDRHIVVERLRSRSGALHIETQEWFEPKDLRYEVQGHAEGKKEVLLERTERGVVIFPTEKGQAHLEWIPGALPLSQDQEAQLGEMMEDFSERMASRELGKDPDTSPVLYSSTEGVSIQRSQLDESYHGHLIARFPQGTWSEGGLHRLIGHFGPSGLTQPISIQMADGPRVVGVRFLANGQKGELTLSTLSEDVEGLERTALFLTRLVAKLTERKLDQPTFEQLRYKGPGVELERWRAQLRQWIEGNEAIQGKGYIVRNLATRALSLSPDFEDVVYLINRLRNFVEPASTLRGIIVAQLVRRHEEYSQHPGLASLTDDQRRLLIDVLEDVATGKREPGGYARDPDPSVRLAAVQAIARLTPNPQEDETHWNDLTRSIDVLREIRDWEKPDARLREEESVRRLAGNLVEVLKLQREHKGGPPWRLQTGAPADPQADWAQGIVDLHLQTADQQRLFEAHQVGLKEVANRERLSPERLMGHRPAETLVVSEPNLQDFESGVRFVRFPHVSRGYPEPSAQLMAEVPLHEEEPPVLARLRQLIPRVQVLTPLSPVPAGVSSPRPVYYQIKRPGYPKTVSVFFALEGNSLKIRTNLESTAELWDIAPTLGMLTAFLAASPPPGQGLVDASATGLEEDSEFLEKIQRPLADEINRGPWFRVELDEKGFILRLQTKDGTDVNLGVPEYWKGVRLLFYDPMNANLILFHLKSGKFLLIDEMGDSSSLLAPSLLFVPDGKETGRLLNAITQFGGISHLNVLPEERQGSQSVSIERRSEPGTALIDLKDGTRISVRVREMQWMMLKMAGSGLEEGRVLQPEEAVEQFGALELPSGVRGVAVLPEHTVVNLYAQGDAMTAGMEELVRRKLPPEALRLLAVIPILPAQRFQPPALIVKDRALGAVSNPLNLPVLEIWLADLETVDPAALIKEALSHFTGLNRKILGIGVYEDFLGRKRLLLFV